MLKKNIITIDNRNLTDTDKYVIDAINTDPKEFVYSTISEFSAKVSSSVSSLSRLSKKLHFKDYQMMRIYIGLQWQKNQETSKKTKVTQVKNAIVDIKSAYETVLADNVKHLNNKECQDIAEALQKSNNVLIFGLGSSNLVVQHISSSLNKMSINNFTSKDITQIIPFLHYKDGYKPLLFVVSKSFETKEVIWLIETARKAKIDTVCITSNGSVLRSGIKYPLVIDNLQQEDRVFSITSKIANFYVVDVILFYLTKLVKDSTKSKISLMIQDWNK